MVDKMLAVEEFFKQALWFLDRTIDQRLLGLTIKVEPTGYLAIFRAITAEGPVVAFYQAQTLDEIRCRLVNNGGLESLKWRTDKYALDGK